MSQFETEEEKLHRLELVTEGDQGIIDELHGLLDREKARVLELEAERERLAAWKTEALVVLEPSQAALHDICKMLGVRLGSSVWEAAPKAVAALKASAEAARPDDIRSQGWSVAVHNDYRLDGERYTFWLFTKDDRALKGEGHTDAEALGQVRAALEKAMQHG